MDRQPNPHPSAQSVCIQDGTEFERRVLARAAEYKDCDLQFDDSPNYNKAPTLATREVPIKGFIPSLLFLEERFLSNPLLHAEPIDRAVQLSFADRLAHGESATSTFKRLIDLAQPWVLGNKLSLLDLLAEAGQIKLPDPYARRLARRFTPWEDQ